MISVGDFAIRLAAALCRRSLPMCDERGSAQVGASSVGKRCRARAFSRTRRRRRGDRDCRAGAVAQSACDAEPLAVRIRIAVAVADATAGDDSVGHRRARVVRLARIERTGDAASRASRFRGGRSALARNPRTTSSPARRSSRARDGIGPHSAPALRRTKTFDADVRWAPDSPAAASPTPPTGANRCCPP